VPVHFEFFGANAPENLETATWVSVRIPGCQRGISNFVSLSVSNGDRIGGVLYHDWNPEAGTIQMSAAGGNGWLTRPVLHAMHAYPFMVARCQMIVLQTAEENTVMRRIAKAYGYRELIIPRLMGRDRNGALLTLTLEDWQASRFYKA
jgi:RimJ/RimL family protein N-acetyltransferase